MTGTCIAALFACIQLGAPSALPVKQVIREAAIDPSVMVHPVTVTGWPGLTTSIQFGDSFEPGNVLCADCLTPGDDEKAAATDGEKRRNWVIEKHVAERSIHVRPRLLPKPGSPALSFATNVYVLLNGGHAINIELRLLDLSVPSPSLGADAVVTIKLPNETTLTGKLAEERRQIEKKAERTMHAESHRLFLERLDGDIRCQPVRWRKPYRNDGTVVRLNQLCLSTGIQKSFWVRFEIENRSASTLYLESVGLEPGTAVAVVRDPVPYFLKDQALLAGQTTTGIVLCSLGKDAEVPSTWRLVLNPASPDRETVTIDSIVF